MPEECSHELSLSNIRGKDSVVIMRSNEGVYINPRLTDFMINCLFYMKTGACRHGNKCSRQHVRPTHSQTILLKNFCRFGGMFQLELKEEEQHEFNDFFREVYLEISEQYGEVEEMNVCDNVGEHMLGNVYIKFRHESSANQAVEALNNRWFNGEPIHCELSPVTDFHDACCRQYENGECNRGGFCNFMHLKKISSSLKRKLEKQGEKVRHKRSVKVRKPSESSEKKEDELIPKKYQDASSSDGSSWSDYGPSSSGNYRSSTPFAFRADRYTSDVSEPDSDTDPELEAHKQLLRRRRWEEMRNKFEMHQKWDEDRERNFVFSLL